MPFDDRLNPASAATEKQITDMERKIDELKSKYILFFSGELKLPPEKEREYIEKAVRKLIYGGAKTAKMDMIIQNLASRFSLYNNLWLKKLNELESGAPVIRKKKTIQISPPPKSEKGYREIFLNLNDEDSFERLYEAYRELLPVSGKTDREKDNIIDSMKAKMLTHNLVEARVSIAIHNGKLSIKIKK
ncbi:MAG: hypothetical protein KJ808_01170 [Acidobacteria bacterium]|nr:hypothetical protein [Acidobacteriota bacterium]MBU4306781.1 hypothetical protein [Acidobacteriota bacterium]MBU4405211.1 hypothetical protein [Acidobacteriota bacterium]MCG2812152.1 hypothetical protein [Candidatus Aminicenantes bacterium]